VYEIANIPVRRSHERFSYLYRCRPLSADVYRPANDGDGHLAIKEGNVWTQEFGQWIKKLSDRFFFTTVKLRKP